jgi:DNA-binding beta-propeller fold protein YncE
MISIDETYVWVFNTIDNTVSQIDIVSGIVSTIDVGTCP